MTVAVTAPASGFVVELPGFSGTLARLASALPGPGAFRRRRWAC